MVIVTQHTKKSFCQEKMTACNTCNVFFINKYFKYVTYNFFTSRKLDRDWLLDEHNIIM